MGNSCARRRELVAAAYIPSEQALRLFPLPDDILICALELLGISDLRSAAGVSRQFYAAAWRSGLCIHCSNHGFINLADPDLVDGEAASWNAIVDHALQKGLRLGFTLVGARGVATPAEFYISALRKLLDAIARSLPILVSLSVTVEVCAYPDLCAALQDPAPCLRSLVIRSCSYQDAPLGPVNLSSGLFSGSCPVLHELGLDCRSLGHEPVPAFSNVVRLSTWRCKKARQLPVARHFPMLRHLMVSSDDAAYEVPPRQLDLSRTTLRSLVFHDLDTSRLTPPDYGTVGVPNLPVFHCIIEFTRGIDPTAKWLGWPGGDCGALAMHILDGPGLDTNIRYAASDGAWRRSYVFTVLNNSTRAYTAPGAVARLEYLRLAQVSLWGLTQCVMVLQTLRRLRVDVSDVDGSQTVRLFDRPLIQHLSSALPTLRCPALESIAILWSARAPAEPVMLDTMSAVVLGRALGANAKPVLELGDIDRERPLALSHEPLEYGSPDIEDVFSSTRRVPCAFGTLLDQFDGDLWNDNVAVKTDRYLSQSLAW